MGRFTLFCSALIAALALPACGGGGGGSPTPAVTHLYFSQDGNGNGLFELDTTTGAATLVGLGNTGTTGSTIGLTETASASALIGSTFGDIANIASDGSAATVIPTTKSAEALAMNITTGILYGAINGAFFTINPISGLKIADLAAPPGGTDIEGLAADPRNNKIYGISRDDTLLYVYDPATDMWSTVANTGTTWLNTGLAYDHLAGVLYAIDSDTDILYTIDPTTAATAAVGPLGINAAGGLAFVVE